MKVFRHKKTDMIWLDFTVDGKRYRRTTKLKYSVANMKLVEKTVAPKIQASIVSGTFDVGGKVEVPLLNNFAEEFFELYKQKVEDRTYRNRYNGYLRDIKPYFENKRLKDIKSIDIEKWHNKFDNCTFATITQYSSMLNSIFEKAVQNELIEKNPMRNVKIKKDNILYSLEDEDNQNPFSEEDLSLLISKAKGYMKHIIPFMYSTGARPSEIIALKWNDIDYENKRIAITKSAKGKGVVGKTKTKTSTRYVDLLPLAQSSLMLQYEETKEYKNDIVFLSRYNTPFRDISSISRQFKKLIIDLNMKNGTLYNLRHTFASVMISKGADLLWVSKMMGHKDLTVTLKAYAKFMKIDADTRLKNIKLYGTYLAQ